MNDARPEPLTVTELTAQVRALLGDAFPRVIVAGQVSNLREQRSGHLYFSLKDEGAQIPAAMWRSQAARLRFRPDDGQEVVARGRIDVYAPHGRYQLIVDAMRPVGVGDLHRRYQELGRRLSEEGLFDPARKRPLPLLPRRVAIVTSPTSAALRDLLRVAWRRDPDAWITVHPVRVQGEAATAEIEAALLAADRSRRYDVIVTGRGGGSLEDLWCFNEERVVRAIAGCATPVVTCVGHETDTTLADHAADARAATPSEAAELVFPERRALGLRLEELRTRADRAVELHVDRCRRAVRAVESSAALARPLDRLERMRERLDELGERADRAALQRVDAARERTGRLAAHLQAVSPTSILERGYSITLHEGRPLRDAASVEPGSRVETRLARGSVTAVIETTSSEEKPT